MEISGGGEEGEIVASQSIRLILFEEAADSLDDCVDLDAWEACPVIAGPLVTVATGKSSLQDHMPRPIRSIASRIGWPEEGYCGCTHRSREMQRSGISSHQYPASCHYGG